MNTTDVLIERYGEQLVWAVGLWLSHLSIWYSFNGLLFVIYHFNWFPQYKIQAGKTPSKQLIRACLQHTLLSHFIIQPLLSYFVLYPTFKRFGNTNVAAPLPSVSRMVVEILACLLILDTHFYWVHRLIHSYPKIYSFVHKRHHMFNVNIGIAAEYATISEDILLNYSSVLIGPLVLGCHPFILFFFTILRMTESIEIHSGYTLPWLFWGKLRPIHGGPKFHEYHHSQNKGNYGFFLFWVFIFPELPPKTITKHGKAECQQKTFIPPNENIGSLDAKVHHSNRTR